jgi:hypothetical protein
MQGLTLMQGTLSAMSSVFGGLGVFFLYHSFAVPAVSAYALIFLGLQPPSSGRRSTATGAGTEDAQFAGRLWRRIAI